MKAKEERRVARDDQDRVFAAGRLMALHEVLSLMQQQADVFEIPLEQLALHDFEPDRDLL